MKVYEDHPIAGLVRLMDEEEFKVLVASMRQRGYRPGHPIVLFEGKILDGRNRYRAAREAGVEPEFTEFSGDDPHAFVWQDNVVRRHLELSQRTALAAMFAADEAGWLEKRRLEREAREAEGRERMAAAKRGRPSNNTPKLTGVSIDTPVNSAGAVARQVPDPLALFEEGRVLPGSAKLVSGFSSGATWRGGGAWGRPQPGNQARARSTM